MFLDEGVLFFFFAQFLLDVIVNIFMVCYFTWYRARYANLNFQMRI